MKSVSPSKTQSPTKNDKQSVEDGTALVAEQALVQDQDFNLLPDMPPSWVPRLTIPRDLLDMRCPKGQGVTLYYKCQHEVFALYGECARWDGMVERLILYNDEERRDIREVREYFSRRADKLKSRRSWPPEATTQEYFERGSVFGLKLLKIVKGHSRKMKFYLSARLDGLVERNELIGQEITEIYQERPDRMIYRHVRYLPQDQKKDPTLTESRSADEVQSEDQENNRQKIQLKQIPITYMDQLFSRNENEDADTDVAKRTFNVAEESISLDYHYGKDRITHSHRTYSKDGQTNIIQIDALKPPPKPTCLLEEYQQLLQAEKDCIQDVRNIEYEIQEILKAREGQEKSITLVTPYYNVVRVKAKESEDEAEEEQVVEVDYLSSFLAPGMLQGTNKSLARDDCLKVREQCLKALKERLIERANIIQARYDEESAALSKRQAAFQRDRDQLTREEEEEYEKQVEVSMFKIHVLHNRLKRHEELALKKYYDLDNKLRKDPRLAALVAT